MWTYILKRILLMVPTLLLVILVSFGVLNFVPGSPAQTQLGGKGTESASGGGSQQSYRLFKEQFNLDKPVFLNTRYALDRQDVLDELQLIYRSNRPACPEGKSADAADAPENCIPAADKPDLGKVVDARTRLSDWDNYIVLQLFEIASDEALDRPLRRLALDKLATNAKLELARDAGGDLTEEQQKRNARKSKINDKIEKWTLPKGAADDEEWSSVLGKWEGWLDKNRQRFEYSAGERLGATFLDTRFALYLRNLAQFDFGISTQDNQPVIETIGIKLRYTIAMTFSSMLLAFLISVPIGVWSAYRQHTWIDQAVTTVLLMLFSLPTFFTGILLLKFFATGDPFDWFPVSGFVSDGAAQMTTLEYIQDVGWHLILPVFCLTYRRFAALSRYARTGIVDVIRSDYVRTARAKGLPESMVVIKHATRNGMIPILTLLGTQLPRLIGGSIVIEVVFGIPGMGDYLLNSIFARDYNALMAVLIFSAILTMIGILISDISYAIADPRISFD